MAFQPLFGTSDLPWLMTTFPTLTTVTTIQLIIVMASTMVRAITNLLKSAQTTFLHITEIEAAPFTVSPDFYLRTVT